MSSTKGVIDVHLRDLCQLFRKAPFVRFLLLVKANILQQHDLPRQAFTQ